MEPNKEPIIEEKNIQEKVEETPKKQKFNIKNISKKQLIIIIIVLAIFFFFFVFTNTKSKINTIKQQETNKEEHTNEILDIEDGTKIDPLSGHNFLTEISTKYTLNGEENELLVYYYGDEETIKINGKKEKYYVLRKEIFLNNYHVLKLYNVEYSKDNDFDEMIERDTYSELNQIINDSSNNSQYILHFYNQAIIKEEVKKDYVKAIIINKNSNILFNFIYKNPDLEANYYEEIDERDFQNTEKAIKSNIKYISEKTKTEITEEGIEIPYAIKKYQVYENGNMDISNNNIFYISGSCKEVQEVLVKVVNGVASSKYQKLYYGDTLEKKGVCE